MTPYAQTIAAQIPLEAQATYAYEYQRYAKDPTLAFVLTLLLGWIGGESYYLGNYARGILMSLALLTGIGTLITIPMWIVRCFTIQNECDSYNDYVAYMLALRYWPQDARTDDRPPAPPESPVASARPRRDLGGLPMPVRMTRA